MRSPAWILVASAGALIACGRILGSTEDPPLPSPGPTADAATDGAVGDGTTVTGRVDPDAGPCNPGEACSSTEVCSAKGECIPPRIEGAECAASFECQRGRCALDEEKGVQVCDEGLCSVASCTDTGRPCCVGFVCAFELSSAGRCQPCGVDGTACRQGQVNSGCCGGRCGAFGRCGK